MNKVDFTHVLPPELLSMITEYLGPSDSHQSYVGKNGLQAVHATCRALRAAAAPFLFENIAITFSLTDEFARPDEAWFPLRWEKPDLLDYLLQNESLRSRTRKLRLRIRPFTIDQWTKERFANMKGRLREHKQGRDNIELDYFDQRKRGWRDLNTSLDANPRSQGDRQKYTITGYFNLFLFGCFSPDLSHKADMTEDAGLLLGPLLSQLPHLKHVETAPETGTYVLRNANVIYAGRLIFRLAPPMVNSILTQSSPCGATGTDGYDHVGLDEMDVLDQSAVDPRLANWVARSPHLTALTINCAEEWTFVPPHSIVPQLWRSAVKQLHFLTTLTLSQTQGVMAFDEVAAAYRSMPPKLEVLLGDVVLPSVKDLTISHWAVTASFFRRLNTPALVRSLSTIERLLLQHVAMVTVRQVVGEREWTEAITDLLQDSKAVIRVEQARLLTMVGREFRIGVLKREAKEALQGLLRR